MTESSTYRVPGDRSEGEIRQKGSRFLALVEPTSNAQSVRQRIKSLQREFADATHVCWAWRIGQPAAEGRSDAGEPNGTAGEPMLRVLQGAGLSDVLAVVIRWFGGEKLGKGGLARAYAGAVQQALETMPVLERKAVTRIRVSLPHSRVGDLKRLVHPPEVVIVEESYSGQAEIVLEVERGRAAEITENLGAFATEVGETGT